MRKNYLFFALCAFLFLSVSMQANTVTVDGATGTTSTYLPVALHTNTSNANYAFHSVSQQLYYASELAGASSTKITAITFDYEGTTFTRKIAVLMNSTSLTSFPLPNEGDLADEANQTPNMVNPGTRVFSGDVNMVDRESYTITFDTPYEWDGTSNIIVTVLDSTAKKNSKTYYPDATIYTVKVRIFETEGAIRFLHKTSKDQSDYANKGWDMNNLAAAKANSSSVGNRKYANRITFTFAPAAVVPATPSDLTVSSVGANIATLSWSAVEGATAYDLEQSTDNENWSTLASNVSGTSFEWTGLSAASTQYARISAKNANGSSAPSSAVTVTTDAAHEHNGISFNKWASTTSMPTSGNYYLNAAVALEPYDPISITLTGNLNLCLNGKTANLYGSKIVVPSGKTLTIYDNEGSGKITGFVASEVGISEDLVTSLIVVKGGGTLVLKQGTIENTYVRDEDGSSYAIYSNGTLRISGDVLINSNDADIYLYSTNVITLDGAISNAEKHTVYKTGGAITSGWSTYMSSADPRDYFESANSARSVCLNEGEASLRLLLTLSESNQNSSIGTSYNQLVDVNLTRSLTSSQYNTFCLPFALSNAELQEIFGAGYDLREFESSSLDGEVLSLTFSDPLDALEAGKPYLIQPAIDVTNPSFEGVTITATSPADQTSDTYISFYGTYAPTELQGGNKNLLFLGADDELFWPAADGNIKGFRAYFEVKGAAQQAVRARIIKGEEADQAIDQTSQEPIANSQKLIKDGQLLIERNGKIYNAQGQLIK